MVLYKNKPKNKNPNHPISIRNIVHIMYSYMFIYTAVTSHHIATPIFVYIKYILLPTTLCLNNIFTIPHTSLRRYTFLSHLTTKSKISVRWIKKLVAATFGVCMFIHKLSLPHITPIIIYPFIFATNAYVICNGGSHPAAIYVVRTFYTPTNNVVPIKYLHHSSHPFAAIHLFISSHDEIKDFCSMDKIMRRDVTRRY